jgi:hypothetical protein
VTSGRRGAGDRRFPESRRIELDAECSASVLPPASIIFSSALRRHARAASRAGDALAIVRAASQVGDALAIVREWRSSFSRSGTM